ncbi:MAG TPA: peptide-methionine (R)-S-oxide reductase MsrB [Bacteroidia bacterium]|nr:peptide-methionine (R)-S-oxide reductase MsrB [Bacteroidia bacterium]HNT80402.1 peptide-methionine (R)-S-oxide reductase MsrB [Bacteroidia bacterium]
MKVKGKISETLILLILALSINACKGQSQHQNSTSLQNEQTMKEDTGQTFVQKSEDEWKKDLSSDQYYVLREKGTERPFTGKFYLHKDKGVYTCAGCGQELFNSDMKFDSHCGWPSFDREIAGGKIKTHRDTSHGMIRTEIVCARCNGHLGHLFDDGPTETGMRYCVNSLSLEFVPSEQEVK